MTPDIVAIEQFLSISVHDHIHVVTIGGEGETAQTHGQWFDRDAAGAAQWASAYNAAGWNTYWTVNLTHPGVGAKPFKHQIDAARFVHVDIDPPKGVALDAWDRAGALTTLLAANPSMVISSGYGYQGLWRLADIQPDRIAVEAVNRTLMMRFAADHCWNIDRLLRLPGTVNHPTGMKRAQGRVASLASIVLPDNGQCFEWEALTHAFPPILKPSVKAADITVSAYDLLTPEQCVPPLSGRALQLVMEPRGADASKDMHAASREMASCGYAPETIMGILMNPALPIHDHLTRQADPQRAAMRSVERGYTDAPAEAFREPAAVPIAGNTVLTVVDADDAGPPVKDDKNSHLCIEWWIKRMGYIPRYNEFTNMVESRSGEPLTDAMIRAIWLEIRGVTGLAFPKMLFEDVYGNMAWLRRYHPVRDYLDRVQTQWDGTSRIDTWLVDIAGAKDTPFVRAVGALFLLAGVERCRNPGVKFDELVVLEGPQGSNKSSLFAALCPDPSWFTDNITVAMSSKEVLEQTQGKWIIEAPELSRLSDSGVEHVKALLSRSHDSSRLAYERQTTNRGRGFIWGGTTNAKRWLIDKSGNRRFWPVAIGTIDLERAVRERDQLWAEAAVRQAAGCSIRLHPSLYVAAAEEQAERMVEDPLEDRIRLLMGDMTGRIRSSHVWDALHIPIERRNSMARKFGEAMRAVGWEYKLVSINGEKIRFYVKGSHNREIIYENSHMKAMEPVLTLVQ